MRMIDADKLLQTIIERKELNKESAMRLVGRAETVEAIPIDWLWRRYCQQPRYSREAYYKRREIVKGIINDYKKQQ